MNKERKPCPDCSPLGRHQCRNCGGSGSVWGTEGGKRALVTCKSCNGNRWVRCVRCNGTGWLP